MNVYLRLGMWKEKSDAIYGAKRGASNTKGSTSVVEEVMTDMEKRASDADEDAYMMPIA